MRTKKILYPNWRYISSLSSSEFKELVIHDALEHGLTEFLKPENLSYASLARNFLNQKKYFQ